MFDIQSLIEQTPDERARARRDTARPFDGYTATPSEYAAAAGWLVDRLSVGESSTSVARYLLRRFRSLPRTDRYNAVRAGLKRHRANGRLYDDIMSGRLGAGV